eukprot:scaffold1009_cov116-Skeletonema_dohrnii-CCMP3373.AAC.7
MNGSIDGHTSTSRKAAETAGCVSQRKSVIVFKNSSSTSRHLATEKQAGLKNNLVPTKKHLVSLSFCCRRVRGMHEASSGCEFWKSAV